jgi:hypothetical protein
LKSAGNVHDILTASEAVVKIGSVDLGTLTYSRTSAENVYQSSDIPIKTKNNHNLPQTGLISDLYIPTRLTAFSSELQNNLEFSVNAEGLSTLVIRNNEYNNNPSAFKTAMNGVTVYYELATPITYTDLIYRDGGIDRPLADVLFNIEVNNWSIEEQLITDYDEQGNPTSIPATIQTKYSIDAVEAIKTLEKSSYFESDIHDNLQAMLTCINTYCASVLGGQFSISETATNKLFNFTFTANASANSIEENTETI